MKKWLISKFLYVFENSDVIQYGLIVEGICNLIVNLSLQPKVAAILSEEGYARC